MCFNSLPIWMILILTLSLNQSKILSRKKRFLVFPEGASLSIAICMNYQTRAVENEIFTEGLNWGISYELPNDTKAFKEFLDKPQELMRRRHRRDLYTKIETIMRSYVTTQLCKNLLIFRITNKEFYSETTEF